MLAKIGTAFKKMAQRSMMRGNRGDAQAISEHGIEGMRNNLQNQPQNVITQKVAVTGTGTHEVITKETTENVKSSIAAEHVKTHTPTATTDKKLGSSILDAIN